MGGSCRFIPLVEYDEQFISRFVEQTENIPDGSELAKFIVDSRNLRSSVRACKGA